MLVTSGNRVPLEHSLVLIHCREELKMKVWPWQHLDGSHFVPYLMYITGAKFEHPTNAISGIHIHSHPVVPDN